MEGWRAGSEGGSTGDGWGSHASRVAYTVSQPPAAAAAPRSGWRREGRRPKTKPADATAQPQSATPQTPASGFSSPPITVAVLGPVPFPYTTRARKNSSPDRLEPPTRRAGPTPTHLWEVGIGGRDRPSLLSTSVHVCQSHRCTRVVCLEERNETKRSLASSSLVGRRRWRAVDASFAHAAPRRTGEGLMNWSSRRRGPQICVLGSGLRQKRSRCCLLSLACTHTMRPWPRPTRAAGTHPRRPKSA